MDSLAALRVFVKVVETGGLSAAGRVLGLAPSSVSRRIGELEAALGVRLLQRSTRKLNLTEAGETYFERSREILRALDEAELAVTERRADPSGILRVSAPASLARRHVAPAIAAFHHRHPAVWVALSVSDRMVDLIGEGFDLTIRVGQLEDSSLMARKLGQARRLLCASPAYLAERGRPARPSALADHACLTFRSQPGSNLWRFRKGDAVEDARASGPFVADDGETLVAAAAAGLGIILVPEWLVGREIADGRLEALLPSYSTEPATTPLTALYAPGPYTAPKIRAFVDFLAARFGRKTAWK